jgi:hypothetical protein
MSFLITAPVRYNTTSDQRKKPAGASSMRRPAGNRRVASADSQASIGLDHVIVSSERDGKIQRIV